MITILIAFCIRSDLAGVTSFVRCLGVKPAAYFCILHFFHSSGVNLENLTQLWITLCLSLFENVLYKIDHYYIIIADSIIRPKEGLKMPAVKALFQSSASNSKAPFVMGHFFECLSFLIRSENGQAHAIPITARIHDGIIMNNKDKSTTIIDRFYSLTARLLANRNYIVDADAYYYAKKMMMELKKSNNCLITRMRTNAIAWEPYCDKKKKRGRRKLYGKKIVLRRLFRAKDKFATGNSPVYGESNVKIKYRVIDAVIRPGAFGVRIVLVVHPKRGKIILLSSNMEIPALKIIEIYGYRYKIEVSFKAAVHQVGVYAYHFWLKIMKKIKKGSKSQDIRGAAENYKEKVTRKIKAYLLYVQLGLIAQGLLKFLSVNFMTRIWEQYDGWLRTMEKSKHPSELVVMHVLNATKHLFFKEIRSGEIWKKFHSKHFQIDYSSPQKVVSQ